jgi:hypothetical protein
MRHPKQIITFCCLLIFNEIELKEEIIYKSAEGRKFGFLVVGSQYVFVFKKRLLKQGFNFPHAGF